MSAQLLITLLFSSVNSLKVTASATLADVILVSRVGVQLFTFASCLVCRFLDSLEFSIIILFF